MYSLVTEQLELFKAFPLFSEILCGQETGGMFGLSSYEWVRGFAKRISQ